MALPQDNAEGYDNNALLSHVDKLKGKLLLIHGTGDDKYISFCKCFGGDVFFGKESFTAHILKEAYKFFKSKGLFRIWLEYYPVRYVKQGMACIEASRYIYNKDKGYGGDP